MRALLLVCLLLLPALTFASEPYLPPDARSITTWQELYRDQRYETFKWHEATQSEYERCQSYPGGSFLTAYPRPSDGQYCYYYSLYMHNRAITWMIVNAGLALRTLDCEWVNSHVPFRGVDLRCDALQADFGAFGR